MAVNFAIALAKKGDRKTALLDLSFSSAEDIQALMDLKGALTLKQYMKDSSISHSTKQKTAFKHGVTVICAGNEGNYAGVSDMKGVFVRLRKEFDYVIVDSGRDFSEKLSPVLLTGNTGAQVIKPAEQKFKSSLQPARYKFHTPGDCIGKTY